MSAEDLNVGRLDAWIRRVVAIALAVGTIVLIGRVQIDWLLSLLIYPFILVAYLLLTAAARIDLAYRVFGWNTTRRRARERRWAARLPPPSPGGLAR